jgi:hypothetical protein
MKNCTYIGGFFYLFSVITACGAGEQSLGDHDDRDSSIATTVAFIDPIAIPVGQEFGTVKIDSSLFFGEERKLAIEVTVVLFKELTALYGNMEEKEGRYVEQVPFTSFLGKDVEMAELEISNVGPEFVRVHADYFDGAPIGGKLFLINKGELFGVEVLQLTEEITENGRVVVESVSHTFYYNEGKVLQVWNNTKEEIDTNSVAWLGENLEQWELVKKQL